jgi:hypothetical protein
MQPTENILMGPRLVILHEMGVGYDPFEGSLIKTLEEMSPAVAIDLGLDKQQS